MIVLRGGTVIDQTGSSQRDVVVDQATGLIVEIDQDVVATKATTHPGEEHQVHDVSGCMLAPGFVDLHAHLRDPGDEAAETVLSGSRAAALGGYTAIVAMPDTDPCLDNAGQVLAMESRKRGALCDVIVSGTVSEGRQGQQLAPMAELAGLGVSTFTDCGSGIQDAGFLQRALEYANDLVTDSGNGCVIAQPCDLIELSAGGQMHEGEWSCTLGLAGCLGLAEELMVGRGIALARQTGARLHLQHLSMAESFDLVREAKAAGVPVTADVSPHHLILTDQACAGYDTAFKVMPPLRTDADVAAARQAIEDGTIDAIATGHAPHSPDAKERPFDQAPAGVLGLETAFAALMTELDLELDLLLGLLSWQPAEIAGLGGRHGCKLEVGQPANLVVIDPAKSWTVEPVGLASRAVNTPFAEREFVGKIRHTLWNGEFVVENFEATR